MKKDPFYVQDFFSKQIENEEKLRKEKLKSYANEQKQIYKDYINKRESEMNKRKETNNSNNIIANENSQRKHYLDSDIFNVKPLPQKESLSNNVQLNEPNNQNQDHPKLTKEEYLAFKEYLKQQERNKQQLLEQNIQQKQQNGNEQEMQKQINYAKTPSIQMMNYHNSNINYHEHQNIEPLPQIEQIPKTPDYNYLKQYANLLKDQEQQKRHIQTQQLIDDSRQEYLNNRNKNVGTYANLTHLMTINPSLKTIPQQYNYVDPEREQNIQSKLYKQQLYKQTLDQQTLENRNNNYMNRSPNYNPCKLF